MGYLMGIDIGSTNYKAIACDYKGKFLATSHRPSDTYYRENGRAEIDPAKLWLGVADCIKEIVEQLPGEKCEGIGIATNGEDVLLDRDGNPVYPTIRWFDTRTSKIAEKWKTFGIEKAYEITGINPNPVAGITRMQWIKEHHPKRFANAHYWNQIQGFVSFKLTGEAKTSYTNACRTMAFDLRKRDWSDEILNAAGLSRKLLPKPVRSGDLVGRVIKDVAELTSLTVGTPVYAGGIDYACGAFATGIIDAGQMLDSTGTSEQIFVVTDEPQVNAKCMNENFTSVIHVVDDKYYMMGMIISSGGIFEWFKREFECTSFDELVAEAVKLPIGANGCMMLPHFCGRYTLGTDGNARGAFLGLTTGTKRGDFVRAIIEGLCFEMYSIINEIQKITHTKIESIYAIGGAAKSDFWLQTKADVTGIIVKSKHVPEAAALGAAMLAGLGAGIYTSSADAVAQVNFPEKVYLPNMENHKKYMKIYETLNQKMYPALAEFNKAVTEMQACFAEEEEKEDEI
jgi:xylulokinase